MMKKFKFASWGLRAHLIILLLFFFTPVLGLVLYHGYEHRSQVIRDKTKDIETLVHFFEAEHAQFMNRANDLLQILSHVPAIQNQNADECNALLKNLHKENPQYSTMLGFHANGDVYCCALPLQNIYNVSDRYWFRSLLEYKKFIAGEFVISRSAGVATLPLAFPLLDSAGNVKSVLSVGLALKAYSSIFSLQHLPPNSTVMVVDRNSKIMFRSPNEDKWLGKTLTDYQAVTQPEHAPKGHFLAKDIDGIQKMFWFQRLPIGQESNDIFLHIAIPESAVFSIANYLLIRNIVMLSLLTIVLAIFAWLYSTKFFLTPATKLASSAKKICEGNLEVKSGIPYENGELGFVGKTFDSMAEALLKRRKEKELSDKAFQSLVESSAGKIDQELYDEICKQLSGLLNCQCVIVGKLVNSSTVQAISMLLDNEFVYDFSYQLEGTPCKVAIEKGFCFFPDKVTELFPDNENLTKIKAVGYVGIPFKNQRKQTIGVLCAFSRSKLILPDRAQDLMSIIGTTVAAEIERVKAEEELRFTKFAIDHSSDSAFWIKPDSTFTYVNEAACQRLGYSREELLSMTVPDICPSLPAEDWQAHWQKVKEKGTVINETEYRTKDDHFLPVEIVVNYLKFGEQEYNCAFVRDISDRKEIEFKLQQAQKMEAIGTLAGGIAHDFNNVLGAILGYAELAKDDAPPDSQFTKDIDKVLIAANRAKDLVRQILAFSRQSKVKKIPLNIKPLIREGLKMLRSTIPSTISIDENIATNPGVILADPTQIHQVLMNLCTNAFHAMEQNGGTLSIEVKAATVESKQQLKQLNISPGKYVELTVSDTGKGMSPGVVRKIFDPYFTTKELGKGTGMGLAIIHGIVTDYGGAITVESKLDKGSTFHVYLPHVREEAPFEMQNNNETPKGNESVLLVDDEELLSQMGKDLLERLGYSVTVRNSSQEALTTFQDNPEAFDLVITDQTMPDMTGSDLARHLLKIKPEIPIILCTGYSNLMNRDTAISLGIKEFVHKPLSKKTIAILIRKVLDNN